MYTIEYHKKVTHDLSSISKKNKERIKKAIETKLVTKPELYGEPLRTSLSGNRKLRVGSYRIVYRINPPKKIVVIIIAHRSDVYKIAPKRI